MQGGSELAGRISEEAQLVDDKKISDWDGIENGKKKKREVIWWFE